MVSSHTAVRGIALSASPRPPPFLGPCIRPSLYLISRGAGWTGSAAEQEAVKQTPLPGSPGCAERTGAMCMEWRHPSPRLSPGPRACLQSQIRAAAAPALRDVPVSAYLQYGQIPVRRARRVGAKPGRRGVQEEPLQDDGNNKSVLPRCLSLSFFCPLDRTNKTQLSNYQAAASSMIGPGLKQQRGAAQRRQEHVPRRPWHHLLPRDPPT